MGAPVTHFEITSAEPERLAGFYRELFGWELEDMPGMDYAVVRTRSDQGIGGGIGKGEGGVTFYAEVPDVDATLALVEQRGGKVILPPTVIPDVVTFAQFADPQGHVVGLAKEAPGEAPPRVAEGGAPVVHFEITSPEGTALIDFYREVLGWEIDADNPMRYGMVAPAGRGIGGGIGTGGEADYVTVYVAVPDLAATLARVVELGGEVRTEPTEIPGTVTFAQFADPAGNLLGLVAG